MNLFDKEERIIKLFQELKHSEVAMYPHDIKLIKLYKSIHNKYNWKKWTNSSGKADLPPDYYNDKLKIMMDVMRVDDHAFEDDKGKIINPHNQRESKLTKELIEKNSSLKEAANNGRLIIIPDSGLHGYQDHNYNFYVNNFRRVTQKHIKKISTYKNNHPNFKMIFMIFDESSPYFENPNLNFEKFTRVGQMKKGNPHFWWLDKNLCDCIRNSNIDYLIWITPYKHFDSLEKVELPQAVIYDLAKFPYDELIEYDERKIESLEM